MQGLLWPGCQWYPEVKERCGLENTKGTGDACAYLPTRTAENFNFMSLISPDTKNAVSVNHNEFVVHFMFIDCRPGAKVQVSRCRVCMRGLRVSTRNWNAHWMYYKGWSSSSVWHYLLQAPTKGGWKLFMCKKPYFGQALGGLRVVGFSKETTGNIFSNSATKTINWLLYCKGKFKTSAEGRKRGTRGLKKKWQKRERLMEQGQHTSFWISATAWHDIPPGWVRSQPATTHQQKSLQPFPKCIWIFWITPKQTPLNVCLWRDTKCLSQFSWLLLSKRDYSLPHFPPQNKGRTLNLLSGLAAQEARLLVLGAPLTTAAAVLTASHRKPVFCSKGCSQIHRQQDTCTGENIRLDW